MLTVGTQSAQKRSVTSTISLTPLARVSPKLDTRVRWTQMGIVIQIPVEDDLATGDSSIAQDFGYTSLQ